MAGINATTSAAKGNIATAQTADSTHDLAELITNLWNEVKRLRLGDTSDRDENVL